MIRVALFGAETILMVWHPRLPVPLPLLALDGGSILVLELDLPVSQKVSQHFCGT